MSTTTMDVTDDEYIFLCKLRADKKFKDVMNGFMSMVLTGVHDDATTTETNSSTDTPYISQNSSDLSLMDVVDEVDDDLFSWNVDELRYIGENFTVGEDNADVVGPNAGQNDMNPILPSVIGSDGFILQSNLSRCSVVLNSTMDLNLSKNFREFCVKYKYSQHTFTMQELKPMVYDRFLNEQFPHLSTEEIPELEFVLLGRGSGNRFKKLEGEERDLAVVKEMTLLGPSVIGSDGLILQSNLSRFSVVLNTHITNHFIDFNLTKAFRVYGANNCARRTFKKEELQSMVYDRFLKEQFPHLSLDEMPVLEFVLLVDRASGNRYKKLEGTDKDLAVIKRIKNIKPPASAVKPIDRFQCHINFLREKAESRKTPENMKHYQYYLNLLSNTENIFIHTYPTHDTPTLQLHVKILDYVFEMLFPLPKNEGQLNQSSESSLDPDSVEANDKKRSSQHHKPDGNAKKQNNGPRGRTNGATGSRNDGAAAAAAVATGMDFQCDQQVLGLSLQYMDKPDRTSALDSDCSALGSDWIKDFDDDYNNESGNDNDGDVNRILKLSLETSNNAKHIVSKEVETMESCDQHCEVGVDKISAGNFANDRKDSLSQQPLHKFSSAMKIRAVDLESNESENADSTRNNVDSSRRNNSFPSSEYVGTAHPAHPAHRNDIDKSEHVKVVHVMKLDQASCLRAAFNGDLQQLKYAHENGCPWDERTCSYAASVGHLDCLQYAHERGCPWDKTTCENAASGGHLDCLIFAHENGCPWDERTCSNAASHGHLECLQYAHKNGCPWYEATCSSAAIGGHLNCLKFAHDNGCPWDETTCANAASGGHLNCLQFARRNGCPWGKRTCSSAALMGHLDCLKFAHKNGCPWDEITCIYAAKRGHHDCLQYARDNGCPWDQKAKHGSREDASTTIGTRTCSDRESMVYQQRSISKFLKSVCRFKKHETTRYCATNTKH